MTRVVVYHHDPVEVDLETSWTGLCKELRKAEFVDIRRVQDPRVVSLFAYARPDAVLTVAGVPVLSLEQTAMNPSGHNIPQRFSCLVRAAELGIPSILYYPEYSRRTFSDPNVRYAQVRVPLAQQRLSELYGVPSLSVFWPTDERTRLPTTQQKAHVRIAQIVDALIRNRGRKDGLLSLPPVRDALDEMDLVVERYAARYKRNTSVRTHFRNGIQSARTSEGSAIDPPAGVTMMTTPKFLEWLGSRGVLVGSSAYDRLRARTHTMVYRTTANAARTDSEHPWPGYLTLFDVLYARRENGRSTGERNFNLVYELPVAAATFASRANQTQPPTATFIVDTFADVVVLTGGHVLGRPLRGAGRAEVLGT